jgi:hypothetical protein
LAVWVQRGKMFVSICGVRSYEWLCDLKYRLVRPPCVGSGELTDIWRFSISGYYLRKH